MTARSLFNIILKVLGIYFIKDIVIAIPTLVSVIYELGRSDMEGGFTTLLFSLMTLFIYAVIIYYLVFRTDLIIDKLKLLERIPEDPVPLNIHRSTVLSISIFVVGLILITQGIPYLIRGLVKWYQYNKDTQGLFSVGESFDYSMILVHLAKIVIGLLFIGNQRAIVNYMELRQRREKGQQWLDRTGKQNLNEE